MKVKFLRSLEDLLFLGNPIPKGHVILLLLGNLVQLPDILFLGNPIPKGLVILLLLGNLVVEIAINREKV